MGDEDGGNIRKLCFIAALSNKNPGIEAGLPW
jgi:hypothetical protein